MIYIYGEREACEDRLVATLDQLDQVVPFLNLLDQYGYWPEGFCCTVFCPDTTNDKHVGVVYHFTDTLEVLGTFDTRSSFLVDKMPEIVYTPKSFSEVRPASDPQEWWG